MRKPRPSGLAGYSASDDESAAHLVRTVRRALGEPDDTPVSEEEEALMAEVRNELPRPTTEEIAAQATRLAHGKKR